MTRLEYALWSRVRENPSLNVDISAQAKVRKESLAHHTSGSLTKPLAAQFDVFLT